MNKNTFLEELREHLQILEDQEQQDIMEEYAQHIDMKIQKGLSEEEAIKDFGSVKELAAEILEAYHVKPEFDRKKTVVKMPDLKKVNISGGKVAFRHGFDWVKDRVKKAGQGIAGGFRWLGRCWKAVIRRIKKLFRRKGAEENMEEGLWTNSMINGQDQAGETGGKAEQQSQRLVREADYGKGTDSSGLGSFLRVIGHGIGALWHGLVALCIWGLKLCWNCGWMLFSLFCGFFALLTLAGLGMCMVLLFQGYPFVGILILCLGGICCFGALSAGAYSLLIRKKKEEPEAGKGEGELVQSGEEVTV